MTHTYMGRQKKSINSYYYEHLARCERFLEATTQASEYLYKP